MKTRSLFQHKHFFNSYFQAEDINTTTNLLTYGGSNGDIGIEGNSGSDDKGEWSEMVWACVKEGWWACVVVQNEF